MGLAERWHGREVEAFERLAHGQACLLSEAAEMALDAAAITLGQLQLGQSGQEPGGRPPFTIGPVRERRPQVRKGRQTQRGSAVSISGNLAVSAVTLVGALMRRAPARRRARRSCRRRGYRP